MLKEENTTEISKAKTDVLVNETLTGSSDVPTTTSTASTTVPQPTQADLAEISIKENDKGKRQKDE